MNARRSSSRLSDFKCCRPNASVLEINRKDKWLRGKLITFRMLSSKCVQLVLELDLMQKNNAQNSIPRRYVSTSTFSEFDIFPEFR